MPPKKGPGRANAKTKKKEIVNPPAFKEILRGPAYNAKLKLSLQKIKNSFRKSIKPNNNNNKRATRKVVPRTLGTMIFKTPIYNIVTRRIEEKGGLLSNEIQRMYTKFKGDYRDPEVKAVQLQEKATQIRDAIDKRDNLYTILTNEFITYKSAQSDGVLISAYNTFKTAYMNPAVTYEILQGGAALIQTSLVHKKQTEVGTVAVPIIPPINRTIVGEPDLTPYRTVVWDEENKLNGSWLVYTSYFRQHSALIQGLKALLPNKLLLNHPGRKPALRQGANALVIYNRKLNTYKQTQAEFDSFNAEYLIQKGLTKKIAKFNPPNKKPPRTPFSTLESRILTEVKPNLELLLKCKADVIRIKAEQEKRKNDAKQLNDLNQPGEIVKRIIKKASNDIPMYCRLVNIDGEDILVPYSNEDIAALESGELEAEGEMYIEIQRMTMFVELEYLNRWYSFPDEPGLMAKLGRGPPKPSFIVKAPRRGGRQSGGVIRFIGKKALTSTVLQNGRDPISVKDLLKKCGRKIDVSVHRDLVKLPSDSALNKKLIFPNGTIIPTTEFVRNFIEMVGIPNGDPNGQASLLIDAFDMIVPISMAEIKNNAAWRQFVPAPRPDGSIIEKFETPIEIARRLAYRSGINEEEADWAPLNLLYKYTKVLKVVDACHDFPQAFKVVIENAMKLCDMNPSDTNIWIKTQLSRLNGGLGSVASQMKLEEFAMNMINELVGELGNERYRREFTRGSQFLPPEQRTIASGNLLDTTRDGERATDILADYVSRIDNVVAFEATDHLNVWGSDGLVAALLKKGCRITKACKRFDNLDAASEAVPIAKYNTTREGIPGAPSEPFTRGWDVTYSPSDTSREPLNNEDGLLCPSAAEKAKFDALGRADGSRIVLNAGLPNVCEVFSKHADGRLKVEVYCQINDEYQLICTHGDTPFSVNTIGQLLKLSGGRGGLLTSARGESPLTWSPLIDWLEGRSAGDDNFTFPDGFSNTAASKQALANILKTNALIDRKCSGDGRMTILFGLGITLDVLAAYFFLLFYGISLILIKGEYKLISLRPLPSNAAVQEEKWKGMQYLKNAATGNPILENAIAQYDQVYTLLEKATNIDNYELEPVAYIAASAAFIKLSKKEIYIEGIEDDKIDLEYMQTKLGEATLESWPYNNIMGWIENVLQTNTAKQTYNDAVMQLNKCILTISTLVPMVGDGQRGGDGTDSEDDSAPPPARTKSGRAAASAVAAAPAASAVAPARTKRGRTAAAAAVNNEDDDEDNNNEDNNNEDNNNEGNNEGNHNENNAYLANQRASADILISHLQSMDEILKAVVNCIGNNEDQIINALFYLLKYGCVWNKTDYVYIMQPREFIAALKKKLDTEPARIHPAMIEHFLARLLTRFTSEGPAVAARMGVAKRARGPVSAGASAGAAAPPPAAAAPPPAAAAAAAAAAAGAGENAGMVPPAPAPAAAAAAAAPRLVGNNEEEESGGGGGGGGGRGNNSPSLGDVAAAAAAAAAAPLSLLQGPGGGGGGAAAEISPLSQSGSSQASASPASASPASASPASASAVNAGGRRRHVTRRRKQKSRRR